MNTRTYTRTYLAEVTETFTFTDDDLTPIQREYLDCWESRDGSFPSDNTVVTEDVVNDIVGEFDSDDLEYSAIDDWQLSIERTA